MKGTFICGLIVTTADEHAQVDSIVFGYVTFGSITDVYNSANAEATRVVVVMTIIL